MNIERRDKGGISSQRTEREDVGKEGERCTNLSYGPKLHGFLVFACPTRKLMYKTFLL